MYIDEHRNKTINKQNKKYIAVINNKKTIHFGDDRYSDYTMHKDPAKKNPIYQDIKMIMLQT